MGDKNFQSGFKTNSRDHYPLCSDDGTPNLRTKYHFYRAGYNPPACPNASGHPVAAEVVFFTIRKIHSHLVGPFCNCASRYNTIVNIDVHCARQPRELPQCASQKIEPDNRQVQPQLLLRSMAAPPFKANPSARP